MKIKVVAIISKHVDIDKGEITRDTSLIDKLNVDSLDVVELVMKFEDAFEICIPGAEAEKMRTVGQIIDFIVQHAGKAKEEGTS